MTIYRAGDTHHTTWRNLPDGAVTGCCCGWWSPATTLTDAIRQANQHVIRATP